MTPYVVSGHLAPAAGRLHHFPVEDAEATELLRRAVFEIRGHVRDIHAAIFGGDDDEEEEEEEEEEEGT